MLGAIIGGTIGAAGNIISQERTNEANANLSRENRDWQAYMSNTAHQREVEDLKAAGLNPTLSAGGNGSSTPSGGAATMQAPQIEMGPILQAMSMGQVQEKIDLEKARVINDSARVDNTLKDSKTSRDLKEAQKKLLGKGLIRAEAESGLASWLMEKVKSLKQTMDSSTQLKRPRTPTENKLYEILLKQNSNSQPTVIP